MTDSGPRIGIIVFPGSNCDQDCYHAVSTVLEASAEFIWHKTSVLPPLDAVLIPGGFSYGDYLRTGAIARFSPVMEAVTSFAAEGGFVLGMMPHPERCAEAILGNEDGKLILLSLLDALKSRPNVTAG